VVRACAVALAAAVSAQPLVAQHPSTQARVDNLLANAALGAVSGGVRAFIKGDPVHTGAARGAIGGTTLGAAKQIAGAGFSGSGALGRVMTSVGVAAINTSPNDTLALLLPLGPLTLEVLPDARDRVRPRVNLWTTVLAAASLLDGHSHFDARASLSTGAIVVTRPGSRMPWETGEAGFAHPGIIYLNRDVAGVLVERRQILAHEAIHVLQWDAYNGVVTRGAERTAVGRAPGGAWLNRYVELNALAPLTVWGIASRFPNENQRPWEREAYRMSGEPLP
jgi:hypothetical protein